MFINKFELPKQQKFFTFSYKCITFAWPFLLRATISQSKASLSMRNTSRWKFQDTWVVQLVKLLTLDFGSDHESRVMRLNPALGSAWSLLKILSPPLSLHLSPACACSCSLSLNKQIDWLIDWLIKRWKFQDRWNDGSPKGLLSISVEPTYLLPAYFHEGSLFTSTHFFMSLLIWFTSSATALRRALCWALAELRWKCHEHHE